MEGEIMCAYGIVLNFVHCATYSSCARIDHVNRSARTGTSDSILRPAFNFAEEHACDPSAPDLALFPRLAATC
jgi:hypothetical protein